jgi:hypothetical protein
VIVSQFDLAGTSDDDVRRMVLGLREVAGGEPPSARRFTDRLALALVCALKERRRLLAIAELDVLEDDGAEGAPVPPGSDPVGEAMDQLRREVR